MERYFYVGLLPKLEEVLVRLNNFYLLLLRLSMNKQRKKKRRQPRLLRSIKRQELDKVLMERIVRNSLLKLRDKDHPSFFKIVYLTVIKRRVL